MFGFQTSEAEIECPPDETYEAAWLANRDLEAPKKLQKAVTGFKKLGTWQRKVDAFGERHDLVALSLAYDVYVDFRDDMEAWSGFLDKLGLTLAPQTKYPISPFLRHLFDFTKRGADRTKQSHWAAAVQFAIVECIDPDHFVGAVEQYGGIYAVANRLKEARKTKDQKLAELKENATAEALFTEKYQPVSVPSEGVIRDLAQGYHTVVLKVADSGEAEIVGRVDETSAAAHKRLMKVVKVEETILKPKPVAKQRHKKSVTLQPIVLTDDHPAIVEGRTLHTRLVREPRENENVLKSGENSRKYGSKVEVGAWQEMPIFGLTLEERKTCPDYCPQYQVCYGNRMSQPRAYRYANGPELLASLTTELQVLSSDPATASGYVIRLHTLGDFYDLDYVKFWAEQLEINPKLYIWGFTERYPEEEFRIALSKIKTDHPDRFRLRWSNLPGENDSAMVADTIEEAKAVEGAMVCPMHTGKKPNCGSCGLCWESTIPIVFVKH